jgi:predicted lysophospholipase L1 biosynthesis ABC-type transport system permease subunit
MRRLLAALFLPAFVAATVLFALTAAVDLWIVGRRLRRERGGPRGR